MNIVQGEFHVTSDADVVLTTLLGSCVSACVHDPSSGVGGLNHFLLPDSGGYAKEGGLRYGVHAMELLINGVLRAGGRRDTLQVWLFGGGRIHKSLADIGGRNADFAEEFVRREQLTYMGGCLRGTNARRIQFWPANGRVRRLRLSEGVELPPTKPVPPPVLNDIELF